jgi:serine/threonine protein kinase
MPQQCQPLNRRLGAYRLLKWLSIGGCSEVYLAVRAGEQLVPFKTVKVVKCASEDAEAIGRFCTVRQRLAQLDHPCIARVIDGGMWRGAPYFVMENAEGLTITEYCRQERLDYQARGDLFTRVLGAVAHAHQQAMTHGDLRAETILIDPNGTPRITVMPPKLTGSDFDSSGQGATTIEDFEALARLMQDLGLDQGRMWLATIGSGQVLPISALHYAG